MSGRGEGLVSVPGVSTHAQHRLREHFGICLTHAEWVGVWSQIDQKKALLVRWRGIEGNHSETWAVSIRNRGVFMAYRRETQCIVTVLPNGRASPKLRRCGR